ncbi:hypothetical protein GJAV_G00081260 [Gymnothorax javanicus]|nr:hypothetical protein GJAV_G00081260 [Gymnothorax javanicus]
MPPHHRTAHQGHSLQIWNGLERDQSEESLLPMTLLCIFAAFGFILLVLLCWKILMEKLQQKDAAETPLSVEETCPHLGPFMPVYD